MRALQLTVACVLLSFGASQDIEEALVKRDIKRQKLAEAKNVPGLVARVNEMNSTALRRRTKMMLPAPQVGLTHNSRRAVRLGLVREHCVCQLLVLTHPACGALFVSKC